MSALPVHWMMRMASTPFLSYVRADGWEVVPPTKQQGGFNVTAPSGYMLFDTAGKPRWFADGAGARVWVDRTRPYGWTHHDPEHRSTRDGWTVERGTTDARWFVHAADDTRQLEAHQTRADACAAVDAVLYPHGPGWWRQVDAWECARADGYRVMGRGTGASRAPPEKWWARASDGEELGMGDTDLQRRQTKVGRYFDTQIQAQEWVDREYPPAPVTPSRPVSPAPLLSKLDWLDELSDAG